MTPEEKAHILIADIEAALARGTRHQSIHGRPLTTVKEVIEALLHDGEIKFEAADEQACAERFPGLAARGRPIR